MSEGKIFSYVHHDGKVATLLTLQCETDFCARTEEFNKLGNELAMHVAFSEAEGIQELMIEECIADEETRSVGDYIGATIAVLREPIIIRRLIKEKFITD